MAISVLQCKDAGSGSAGASLTVSGLSAITLGSTIVVFVGYNHASATITSFSGGGGIAVANQSGSTQTDAVGDNSHTACYILGSATSADTSVTVNFSGALSNRAAISIFELSGTNVLTPLDVTAHSQISHNIAASVDLGSGGSVTTATNGAVVLGFAFNAFTGTMSPGIAIGTGETLGANSAPGDSVSEYKTQALVGAVSSTFTATGATGTTDLSCWTVAIRPAAISLLGQDGTGWASTQSAQQQATSGGAVSSNGRAHFPGSAGNATTAWINIGGGATTANTAKVCLYDASDNLVAVSAAITANVAGLHSGAISATLTSQNYTLAVVTDTGFAFFVNQTGSSSFADRTWTTAHFPYASPPNVLPASDGSSGQEFIVYLTGGGNAYNLACNLVTYSHAAETISFGNTSAIHNYVLPAAAAVFDRVVGSSTDDFLILSAPATYSLSIGGTNFHPAGTNLAVSPAVFLSTFPNTAFIYLPGTGSQVPPAGVPCSYDFANYPAFRTAVQQLIDGDDVSSSSLSTNILDLIISLGERRVYRDVRSSTQDTALTLTVTSNSAPLPVDLIELRSVFFPTGDPAQYMPYEDMQAHIQRSNSTVRRPYNYSFEGENLIFWPIQGDGTVISGRYYKRFCSIVTEGLVGNTFFNRYPDLWLYACLLEAAPYIGELTRMAEWEKRYEMLAADALEYERRRFTRGSKLRTRLA